MNITDSCWLWAGYTDKFGYGMLSLKLDGHWTRVRAHRELYKALRGDIADDLVCDHLCRITTCINPDHIDIVTSGENVLRGTGASARNARKTHCIRGHLFSPDNTYYQLKQRRCKTCHSEWSKQRNG